MDKRNIFSDKFEKKTTEELHKVINEEGYQKEAKLAAIIIGNLLNNFAPYIYSIFLHGHYGQTLGKMAMGVRVVDFDTEDEIDLKQAFIRDSVPVALMAVLYAYSLIIFYGNEGSELQADFVTLAPLFFIGLLTML